MSDIEQEHKSFRTLQGFLSGEEPEEEDSFAYSATLRIFAEHLDFDDVNHHLGLSPTSFHRRGDRKDPESPPFQHDFWSYSPPIDQERELAQQGLNSIVV